MQKSVNITTPDKKTIYGKLDTPKGKSKGLIIFVHGLTGHLNEHIFFNGAKYFTDRGFSTYRFNLYGWEKDARNLDDTSLKEHSQDLNTIVHYFKKKGYSKIFVIGHSFGGLTILYSDTGNISGFIFRDGSTGGKGIASDAIYDNKSNKYIMNRGIKSIISKNMYNDFCIDPKHHVKKMGSITIPVKIINAGNGILKIGGKKYYQAAKGPKEFVIIPGAGHCFDEEGVEQKLFAETYKRIKKYS